MLGLFVTKPWPSFYSKGMKTWEIRSYSTDYRGPILLIESGSNIVICKMDLIDCIPLNKERWEMNYEKHRTSCSYEELPYRKKGSPGYAWVLQNPCKYSETIIIERSSTKPYAEINDSIVLGREEHKISFNAARIACKFIGSTMLLYLLKKNYFALIAISNLVTNETNIITEEISDSELDYVISQINAY